MIQNRRWFFIVLGKIIIPPGAKYWTQTYRKVWLVPVESRRLFREGEMLADTMKRIAPRLLMTENGITDMNIEGIKVALKKLGYEGYRLERERETNLMVVRGTKFD